MLQKEMRTSKGKNSTKNDGHYRSKDIHMSKGMMKVGDWGD